MVFLYGRANRPSLSMEGRIDDSLSGFFTRRRLECPGVHLLKRPPCILKMAGEKKEDSRRLRLPLILLFSPPSGYFLSHQPPRGHLPGSAGREGAPERHHALRRAIHQNLRREQGSPLLFFRCCFQSTRPRRSKTQDSSCFACRRQPRRFSKRPNRRASAWVSTGCPSPGRPSKPRRNISQDSGGVGAAKRRI